MYDDLRVVNLCPFRATFLCSLLHVKIISLLYIYISVFVCVLHYSWTVSCLLFALGGLHELRFDPVKMPAIEMLNWLLNPDRKMAILCLFHELWRELDFAFEIMAKLAGYKQKKVQKIIELNLFSQFLAGKTVKINPRMIWLTFFNDSPDVIWAIT